MKVIYSDKIVMENGVQEGFIRMNQEGIAEILPHYDGPVDYDYGGYYVMPGLVNIHSEYVAREAILSANKIFPLSKIFRDVETRYLSGGVTTLFHSVELVQGRYKNDFMSGPQMVKELRELSKYKPLVDHKTHMEFPLSFIDSMDKIKELMEGDLLDYVSYLGFFRNEEERYREAYYQEYVQRVMGLDDEMVEQVVQRVRELRSESNLEELAYLIKFAHYKGLKVGSAELSSVKKLGFLQNKGVNIIEFPTSMDTIQYAKENNKYVLIDTMSLIKGKKVKTSLDLVKCVQEGLVDILCADTRSYDLVAFVFYFAKTMGMENAVKLATLNPAQALGLKDRGVIAPGKRGDIIAVEELEDGTPLVRAVHVAGKEHYKLSQ